MNQIFSIGSFCFRVICENEIPVPPNFLLFASNQDAEAEYTYHLSVVDELPTISGKLLADREDIEVFATETGEWRRIGVKFADIVYGGYHEKSTSEADVLLVRKETEQLNIDTAFSSLFALERHMIKRDSLVLHCAYMVYQGKAILFSAPSETGKSTQAALWEQYRDSRTVNGDRALLQKRDSQWMAGGWPVCGSSEICRLEDEPIYAIVMLRQGKTNHVEKLSPIQAFAQLYAQITINQWNREFVQRAMELIEDLIGQVPVYQLTCDISEDAVRCLEGALFPDIHTEKE